MEYMKKTIAILFGIFMLCNLACENKQAKPKKVVVKEPIKEKIIKEFDLELNKYVVVKDTVKPGDSFGDIMDAHGVTKQLVFEISNKVKDSFNVAKINSGRAYTILKTKDSIPKVEAFIYQKNKIDYAVLHLEDSIYVENKAKQVVIKRKSLSGVIENSLSTTIEKEGASPYLTFMLSNIYQWSIDFFKIQKGDQFKVLYDEKYLEDGTFVGIDNIEACVFVHENEPFYAFQYEVKESSENESSYFDEKAKSLQSFFLKAPLNFSRISSRFSPRRFHPVQKRWKAHKGTDYAAPRGTPIWSTANGVVSKTGYTGGNGKYVKIKHNKTFSTQYLHMSKILVKKGQQVKQGQVIGKVGSTGLATGPHVCYRFWKNGKQVDPYRQKLPSAKNIAQNHKEAYLIAIEPIKKELDSIPFKNITSTLDNDESITFIEPNTDNCLETASGAL